MNNKKIEDLLASRSFVMWIKGECNTEEKEYWDSWLQKEPENRILAEDAKEIIMGLMTKYETPDLVVELNKLDQVIDHYEDRNIQLRDNNYKRMYRRSRSPILVGVLFFIVLLGSIYTYWTYPTETEEPKIVETKPVQEYSTEYGEKLTFRLSDGSRIVLNGNSNLKFSSKIEKGLNTEVWLKGEAYFDITRYNDKQQRTFTVHTEDGSIKVLGTRFSVNTFEKETKTVLEEGRISVRVINESQNEFTEYRMNTGQMAQFSKNDNKITIKEVNTLIHTSWTKDKLIFQNTPMEDIARRITQTFGIEVIVGADISDKTLSGSIKSDNLEVLTEALAEILSVTIKKQDQKLIIGTEN